MAFKLKPPYAIDWTPIYTVKDEPGVNARTWRNGVITINENITDPAQRINTISHEKVHIQQIKSGKLDYDLKRGKIFWNQKEYKDNYSKQSPWEQEAYAKEIPISKIKKHGIFKK